MAEIEYKELKDPKEIELLLKEKPRLTGIKIDGTMDGYPVISRIYFENLAIQFMVLGSCSFYKREGNMSDFREELSSLLNKHSKENGSNTPDFILAEYLDDCLKAYDKAVEHKDRWHTKETPDND